MAQIFGIRKPSDLLKLVLLSNIVLQISKKNSYAEVQRRNSDATVKKENLK